MNNGMIILIALIFAFIIFRMMDRQDKLEKKLEESTKAVSLQTLSIINQVIENVNKKFEEAGITKKETHYTKEIKRTEVKGFINNNEE